MKSDEVTLSLTIKVRYEMGRTSSDELASILVQAADHLAANGLLSGDTEASVLTWDSWVTGGGD